MPTLTRWYIKTALVYFVAALSFWIVSALPFPWISPRLTPALGPTAVHLFTVGWLTQMIFGVAHWMFPRYSRDRPRGIVGLAVAAYVGLNLGLPMRAIAEPLSLLAPSTAWPPLLLASAILQWLAGVAFAIHIWVRVKER